MTYEQSTPAMALIMDLEGFMRRTLAAVTGLLAVAGGVGPVQATAYTYQIFNTSNIVPSTAPPGGNLVFAGINDAGQIVGDYNSGPIYPRGGGLYEISYAFSYNAGTFTAINAPGASFNVTGALDGTSALAINNNDQILTSTSAGYFLGNNGIFTSLPVPTATSLGYASSQNNGTVFVNGIDNSGDFVGEFKALQSNGFSNSLPFVYKNGKFSIVNFFPYDPGYDTGGFYDHIASAAGINDAGEIIGQGGTVTNDNGNVFPSSAGLLNNGGVVSLILDPSSAGGIVSVAGISNSGLITGTFSTDFDKNNQFTNLSFVDDNGVFSTLDVPGLSSTNTIYGPGIFATGINSQGDVVGYIRTNTGGTEAFLATPVPEPASITLLGAGLAAFGVAARRRRKGA